MTTVNVTLTPCDSMSDAMQHADASGETPIIVCNVPGITHATIRESELRRVGRYLDHALIVEHEPTGRLMTIPVDYRPEG